MTANVRGEWYEDLVPPVEAVGADAVAQMRETVGTLVSLGRAAAA